MNPMSTISIAYRAQQAKKGKKLSPGDEEVKI